ncbi:hypothetical protein B0J18DRAFT_432518 [Chaetomium sp. MPI-SDFR-AT-0129]|nr:hypothetical protein B0J18DRAFT_432518 [Chaetomium sp. MPI-SDFR-AT-0129]
MRACITQLTVFVPGSILHGAAISKEIFHKLPTYGTADEKSTAAFRATGDSEFLCCGLIRARVSFSPFCLIPKETGRFSTGVIAVDVLQVGHVVLLGLHLQRRSCQLLVL